MANRSLRGPSAWWVAGLVVAGSVRAAAVPCSSLPNPVYFTGSTVGHAMFQQIAARVADENITYVFQERESCAAVHAITESNGTSCSGTACLSGSAEYYRASTTTSGGVDTFTCDIADPRPADLALSDFFLNTCAPGTDPGRVADITGPVRPLVFVTPAPAVWVPGAPGHWKSLGISFPHSITRDEAFLALGFNVGNVPPWMNPSQIFLPGPESTEQRLLSRFLGIPPDQMSGTISAGQRGVVADMNRSVCEDRSRTLGFVGADYYDQHRGAELEALAYAGPGQAYAYTPDFNSAPNYTANASAYVDTRDKQNVRDGHYGLWSYLHVIARADGLAQPLNPEGVRLEQFFHFGTPVGPIQNSYDAFQGALDSSLVPACAMTVKRNEEAGGLYPYPDPSPCGCGFAARVDPNTPTPVGCLACSVNSDCGSGHKCRYGFCEAR